MNKSTTPSTLKNPTSSMELTLKSIQQLIKNAQFIDAIKQTKILLKNNKNKLEQIELWYLQAVAQRYNKAYNDALESINELLKLKKEHSRGNQEQGHIYLSLDQKKLAQQSFERAVKFNPSLVSSWQALILIYRDLKLSDKVQEVANQLSSLEQLPPALLAVTELIHERNFLKAEQICRHFLLSNKEHIVGMCLLAEIGINLKIYSDAEFLLATALELQPNHIHARAQYLNLLIRLGKYKLAKQQVNKVLLEQPDNNSFNVAKANILIGLGEMTEGINLLKQVISKEPNNAGIHLQLGHAFKAKGNIEQAIEAYKQAYQLNPSYGDAFWSLANTKTYRFNDEEIAQMQAQQNNDLAVDDKVHLYFATGKAFEDRQQYDQAFQAYQMGNKLKQEYNSYDSDKTEQFVEDQINYCTNELFEIRGSLGLDSHDPIFIVGLPRAGSTLLEQILASHSQVDGTMELHNILGLASRLSGRTSKKDSQYPQNLHHIDKTFFRRFGQQFIDETQIYRDKAPLFIDKMPNNFLHIGLIRLILPNAKIIDARRSPMACCFSGFKQLFAEGQNFTYSLEDIGLYYQSYIKLMTHWDEVLPGFVLKVEHEDVVNNLEREVRRILDFCGLAFEQSCVDFHKTSRTIKTPSSEQVRQPIYKNSTEQWRHFESHLTPLKRTLNLI